MLDEVAKELTKEGFPGSIDTVRRLIKAGELREIRKGRTVCVDSKDLKVYMEGKKNGGCVEGRKYLFLYVRCSNGDENKLVERLGWLVKKVKRYCRKRDIPFIRGWNGKENVKVFSDIAGVNDFKNRRDWWRMKGLIERGIASHCFTLWGDRFTRGAWPQTKYEMERHGCKAIAFDYLKMDTETVHLKDLEESAYSRGWSEKAKRRMSGMDYSRENAMKQLVPLERQARELITMKGVPEGHKGALQFALAEMEGGTTNKGFISNFGRMVEMAQGAIR